MHRILLQYALHGLATEPAFNVATLQASSKQYDCYLVIIVISHVLFQFNSEASIYNRPIPVITFTFTRFYYIYFLTLHIC